MSIMETDPKLPDNVFSIHSQQLKRKLLHVLWLLTFFFGLNCPIQHRLGWENNTKFIRELSSNSLNFWVEIDSIFYKVHSSNDNVIYELLDPWHMPQNPVVTSHPSSAESTSAGLSQQFYVNDYEFHNRIWWNLCLCTWRKIIQYIICTSLVKFELKGKWSIKED